jgi:hypothetical protein
MGEMGETEVRRQFGCQTAARLSTRRRVAYLNGTLRVTFDAGGRPMLVPGRAAILNTILYPPPWIRRHALG